jgi:predicted glycogen debranching enzyme
VSDDLIRSLVAREWLLPLGNGGYASGTWSGLNARSYHGLLVGGFAAPIGRYVLVSHVDPVWEAADGTRLELATHHYHPDIVHPRGFLRLQSFRAEPTPTWEWALSRGRLRCVLEAETGRNAVRLRYSVQGEGPGRLILRPFLTSRSFHGTDDPVEGDVALEGNRAHFRPGESRPSVHLETEAPIRLEALWHRNFRRELERRRGFEVSEDQCSPFVIECDFEGDDAVELRFCDEKSLGAQDRESQAPSFEAGARPRDERRRQALERLRLAVAAPLIRHPATGEDGVLAGYHWFNEWGRDTMIALPGIAHATGDWERVRHVLEAWSARVSLGMLPNRMGDREEIRLYNSADAPLWFIRAIEHLHRAAPEESSMRRHFLPAMREILRYYVRGTRYGIRVDDDGLLMAGATGTQLTWMDAKVGEFVVTPRHGKCVELNALFYDSLCFYAEVAREYGREESADAADEHAAELAASFEDTFWNEARGHYRDVVGESLDEAMRPNQLAALASSRLPLTRERAERALDALRHELWTPYGLRTLTPLDSRYRGRYEGDGAARDRAYHQGTVWPWLLGLWADALRRWERLEEGGADRAHLEVAVDALLDHLDRGAVGHVAEVYDGDPPHRPAGAVAQAWSASETFRAALALGWLSSD